MVDLVTLLMAQGLIIIPHLILRFSLGRSFLSTSSIWMCYAIIVNACIISNVDVLCVDLVVEPVDNEDHYATKVFGVAVRITVFKVDYVLQVASDKGKDIRKC